MKRNSSFLIFPELFSSEMILVEGGVFMMGSGDDFGGVL